MTFLEQCEQLGIKRGTAQAYRKAHPELTEEQILEYYRDKEYNTSFTEKCRRASGNYNTYRYNHRDLTPLQALMYYSGKCYINWLGELVILEED